MKLRHISPPELGLVAMTRGMLGVGIGLLLSGRLDQGQRRAVGWTLVGVGLVTTIPLALMVFGRRVASEAPERHAERMAGASAVT